MTFFFDSSLCYSPWFSLVKHTSSCWLPNMSWQIFDRSLQVFCYCIAFRQSSLTRTFQMSRHGRNRVSVNHPVRGVNPVLCGKLTQSFCSFKLFVSFLFCNWHFSQLGRWSGVPHMLVLALWHAFKLSCQRRQWCCHCRHLNKKCCK